MLRTTSDEEYILTSNEMRKMYDFLKEKEYDDPIMSVMATYIEAENQVLEKRRKLEEIPANELLDFANTRFGVDDIGEMGGRKFIVIDAGKFGLSCSYCALTDLCEFNDEFCKKVKCNNPKGVRKVIFEEV